MHHPLTLLTLCAFTAAALAETASDLALGDKAILSS